MHGLDFWGLLSDGDRQALLVAARPRVYRAGMALCREGDPSTHVFILVSGWVKVITVTHDGQEMLEALRGSGDVVGEIAGQVTGYRTATIEAIEAVNALLIGTEQFGEFLDSHPSAAHAHRRVMADRQRVTFESYRNHVLASGSRRLACLLLDLAARRGGAGGGALSATLPLSQEEVASLIGASRSTVTRALREWRSRQIIRTDQRNITILDRAGLLKIAGRAP